MHGHRLAVERLPVGIRGLVDDGEEAQALQLAEDPQRRARALDQAVRRAEADVGLAADHGLVGEVLVGELDQLDLGAPLAHAIERDEQRERLDRLDVAERDPDGAAAFATSARPDAPSRRRRTRRGRAPARLRVHTPSSCPLLLLQEGGTSVGARRADGVPSSVRRFISDMFFVSRRRGQSPDAEPEIAGHLRRAARADPGQRHRARHAPGHARRRQRVRRQRHPRPRGAAHARARRPRRDDAVPRRAGHHAHRQGGRGDLLHPLAPREHRHGPGRRAHHRGRARASSTCSWAGCRRRSTRTTARGSRRSTTSSTGRSWPAAATTCCAR